MTSAGDLYGDAICGPINPTPEVDNPGSIRAMTSSSNNLLDDRKRVVLSDGRRRDSDRQLVERCRRQLFPVSCHGHPVGVEESASAAFHDTNNNGVVKERERNEGDNKMAAADDDIKSPLELSTLIDERQNLLKRHVATITSEACPATEDRQQMNSRRQVL